MKYILLFLVAIPAFAKSIDCYVPDDPRHAIKAIYNTKKMKNEIFLFFNNGRRTITSSIDYTYEDGRRLLIKEDAFIKIRLDLSGDYYDDNRKPSAYESELTLKYGKDVEYIGMKFVCRTYRWPI